MLLESYIWIVLVFVIVITIGVTLAFDHFYKARIFTPVYEATVKSICSNIDMWSKAVTTIDPAYARSIVVTALLHISILEQIDSTVASYTGVKILAL